MKKALTKAADRAASAGGVAGPGSGRERVFEWASIAILLLCIDYVTGPYISFPITYIIPIGLAAWYAQLVPALALAVLMPVARLLFAFKWPSVQHSLFELSSTLVVRVLVLASFAVVLAKLGEKSRLLAERVQVLEGMLPICSFCKKIRDDKGDWQPVDSYVARRTGASFTHGFCEACIAQHYGEYSSDG